MKAEKQSSFVFWGNRIYDWMILNFLWILTSVLGFGLSLGAATGAMYYAIRLGMKEERGSVLKLYFEGLKKHWKQTTLIWILQLLLLIVIVLVSNFGMIFFGKFTAWILPFYGVLALEMLLISIYAIPLSVNFSNSTRDLIQKSFRIAHAHLWNSLLMMAAVVGSVFLVIRVNLIFLYVLPSLLAWWMDRVIIEKIVKKIDQKQ